VLRHCNLSIRAGDRILLEGPSGGGNSTLASLLAGFRSRNPDCSWQVGLTCTSWATSAGTDTSLLRRNFTKITSLLIPY
jgi:ABC-type lipoprotein export system ATPase subunit